MKKTSPRKKPRPAIELLNYMTPEEYAPLREVPGWLRAVKASENPCARCPSSCCKLQLNITPHDVARIAVHLSIDPREFCQLNPRKSKWVLPPVTIDGERRHLGMKSSIVKPCVFLHTIGSASRCSIYELRPMTCRLYPFRFAVGDHAEGPELVLCPERWVLTPAARRRIEDVVRRSLVEEEEALRALRTFARQRRFPRTEEGFLRYALIKGSDFLGLDPGPLLARLEPRRLGKRLW